MKKATDALVKAAESAIANSKDDVIFGGKDVSFGKCSPPSVFCGEGGCMTRISLELCLGDHSYRRTKAHDG